MNNNRNFIDVIRIIPDCVAELGSSVYHHIIDYPITNIRKRFKNAAYKKASKKVANVDVTDKIINIGVRIGYMNNMILYSIYIWLNRFVPNIDDGLKPVQRRILYAMWHDIRAISKTTKKKSAKTVGAVIGTYHPHGDSSVYGAMKPLTNSWECKVPLICYDSNSGSIQGGPQAAMRYTESYLSQFSMDCIFADLIEDPDVCDYVQTYSLSSDKEPVALPVRVPLLLVNGAFGIAIGERIEVPKHSLNDVIDAALTLLKDPNANISLIPDQCLPCDIIETDWRAISETGTGSFVVRGKIDIIEENDGRYSLALRSVPDLVTMNNILEKIEDMIKNNMIQVDDIKDFSGNDYLDIRLILKKGSDPEYVKSVIYKNTSMQDTKKINLKVITSDNIIMGISYKEYILNWIAFRRVCINRIYSHKLKRINTQIHPLELYVLILESGKIDEVIAKIRKNKSNNDTEIVEWLCKLLNITPVQAGYISKVNLKDLSLGKLKSYKEQLAKLNTDADECVRYLTTASLIDERIISELNEIKAKYGAPRLSTIISEAQASNIPAGTFKVIFTEAGFLRKLNVNEVIKAVRGDNPKFVLTADNDKDILLFDELGKVFKIPVSKIPFTDKSGVGVDVRIINKKINANIISMMYCPMVEEIDNMKSKNYLIVVSSLGMIKKIDLTDITTTPPSGMIYSKVNDGDTIKAVEIANHNSDVVVYTNTKALRLKIDDDHSVPYNKRSTIGNRSIKSNDPIDGISIITSNTADVVVCTYKGNFNKFSASALPTAPSGNRAGVKVIALSKGDYIKNIFSYNTKYYLKVFTASGITNIDVKDIPVGSSISAGEKLIKDNIIKIEAHTN